MKKLFIKTYGCQMNVYDSARMAEVLAIAPVFALARLVFWAGYLTAPILRAPGMAASFAASAAALGWALAVWLP